MDVCALIVDDSKIMRKLVMRSLTETKLANFTFIEAEDGLDALDKYDPATIQICFVDWNMPKMTGIEFVRAMREQSKETLAVMVTTERTMGRVEEAMDEAGADSYVVKPFTAEVLKQKIEPLFEKLKSSGGGFFSKLASGK
jgi:two-component system, chemotaxis family, chemotaxis protein CheY